MAEWLRRWTANPLGSPRVGSNPILVDIFLFLFFSLLELSNRVVLRTDFYIIYFCKIYKKVDSVSSSF